MYNNKPKKDTIYLLQSQSSHVDSKNDGPHKLWKNPSLVLIADDKSEGQNTFFIDFYQVKPAIVEFRQLNS